MSAKAQASKTSLVQRIGNFLYYNRGYIITTAVMLMMMVSIVPMHADDIWQKVNGILKELIVKIKQIYCYRLAPLFVIIDLIIMGISKDDRKVAMAKQALIWIAVSWLCIMGLDTIFNTLTDLKGKTEDAGSNWTFDS